MGTIIAVAAVLEMNMDRNIVVVMKPNIKRLGLWPEGVETNNNYCQTKKYTKHFFLDSIRRKI